MSELLRPEILSRAAALGLKARTLVEGLRSGEQRSPFRGFSVEFVQHREYVPGDDPRYIDWKVFGRSERYTIKQFEQETNFAGHLLVDVSRSMLYGQEEENKLQFAKLLAASLAYVLLHDRNGVGLNLFADEWRTRIPPSSQPGSLPTMLAALEEAVPSEKTDLGALLHRFAESTRRRGVVFLISDGLDEADTLLDGLRHLRAVGHEVVFFHVLHPDELTFPFSGMVRFEDLESASFELTRPQQIRAAYLRVLQEFLDRLEHGCVTHRCDYVRLRTDRPLADVLARYLAHRHRVRRV